MGRVMSQPQNHLLFNSRHPSAVSSRGELDEPLVSATNEGPVCSMAGTGHLSTLGRDGPASSMYKQHDPQQATGASGRETV